MASVTERSSRCRLCGTYCFEFASDAYIVNGKGPFCLSCMESGKVKVVWMTEADNVTRSVPNAELRPMQWVEWDE